MGIDRRPFPGQRALAGHILDHAAAAGFDIAKAEELKPDHGIALPLAFVDPDKRLPVVPLLVNINMTPRRGRTAATSWAASSRRPWRASARHAGRRDRHRGVLALAVRAAHG